MYKGLKFTKAIKFERYPAWQLINFFLAIDWAAAVSSPRDKALRMLPGYRFAYNIFRWR